MSNTMRYTLRAFLYRIGDVLEQHRFPALGGDTISLLPPANRRNKISSLPNVPAGCQP